MNICNYCSDFWGAHGDVSVKDAWGKWANEDRLNKSIVISRNDLINKVIENSSEINYEILQLEDVINPQMITIIYKQIEAENKLYKKLFAKENIKNGLLKNIIILKLSKFFYRILGFKISYGIMRLINKAVSIYAKQ